VTQLQYKKNLKSCQRDTMPLWHDLPISSKKWKKKIFV